ncbi:MAG: hypothetical protein V2I25_16030 [Woeseiaceae bacterium]|jgi:hypothetical protein|nr:hypothetical protein [Woeseiaceae bacterium]
MLIGLVVNAGILSVLLVAAAIHAVDPDLYYRAAQEDRLLEWFTFWAFVLAGFAFLRNAYADRRARGGIPWFAVGLGVFCLLVGLEEISWGQRLFAYRPPEYFLEENFQQEFNLHNVIGTDFRKLGMQFILLGYGVVMSLAAAVPAVARVAARWRLVASPVMLAPAFAIIAAVYAWYPADFTGEWVEAATGLAFLACALLTRPGETTWGSVNAIARHAGIALFASLATLGLLRLQHGSDAERIDVARAEIAALVADFESPRVRTRCNIHKRLYTFMRDYGQSYLVRGEFAGLLADTGNETRAAYLLDPWNSPYWVRHKCRRGRAVAFVYSFGPNRRRDSTEWELGGDDIGAYFSPD